MDASDDEYGTKAARLLAKAQAAGIKTSIDIVSEQSDRFARVVRPALRHCDYCIVNEIEGSLATGAAKDDLHGICEGLLEAGVRERAVVHCPEAGVSLGRDGEFVRVGSLELPDGWVKGTVGAGDAFCAEHLLGDSVAHLYEEVRYLIRGEVMAPHKSRDIGPERDPREDEIQIGSMGTHDQSRSAMVDQFLKTGPVILRVQSELEKRSSDNIRKDPVDESVRSYVLLF
jgi:hypothetical protein